MTNTFEIKTEKSIIKVTEVTLTEEKVLTRMLLQRNITDSE